MIDESIFKGMAEAVIEDRIELEEAVLYAI